MVRSSRPHQITFTPPPIFFPFFPSQEPILIIVKKRYKSATGEKGKIYPPSVNLRDNKVPLHCQLVYGSCRTSNLTVGNELLMHHMGHINKRLRGDGHCLLLEAAFPEPEQRSQRGADRNDHRTSLKHRDSKTSEADLKTCSNY